MTSNQTTSLFDEFPCLKKYFYGLNLTAEVVNQREENFCIVLTTVEYYANFVCRHILLVLLLLLIITSLIGKIRENYKWIIFHSASLNFIIIGKKREKCYIFSLNVLAVSNVFRIRNFFF
jgi:hypothetical protein